ncbi:hypothetical protein MTR67_007112 [Solanum verrucosum]|uniref:Tf2-1-like SH3-like domain-containing protein n=1 Tax=Solanum verrucosum TaxID=315347 RepID=A0AAF0PZJ6_SOLVR|nr:hypothetical protein MTR67_007112 [Solanum verrucosum]
MRRKVEFQEVLRDFREIAMNLVLSSLTYEAVMKFGKKGKLSLAYVVPYKILKRVGNVAYQLELPAQLAAVHPVFHISLLKKCVVDPASIVPLESVAVNDSLTYKEVPVDIFDCQVRRMRIKKSLQ